MSRSRVLSLLALVATSAQAQPGVLFPEPFRVEHQVLLQPGDGDAPMALEPVVDTYSGSWIVSERGDGSRRIVDFARREVTEVDPARGTYWTLGFSELGDLMSRAAAAQGLLSQGDDEKALGEEPEIEVVELAPARDKSGAKEGPWSRPGVRHLRATEKNAEKNAEKSGRRDATLEVWLDGSIRLTPLAERALAGFAAALGRADARQAARAARLEEAVRARAEGALVVRRLVPLRVDPAGETAPGWLDDVATQVERVEALAPGLVTVPEGLRRVAHPLEVTVRFLDEDEERRRLMSGAESER